MGIHVVNNDEDPCMKKWPKLLSHHGGRFQVSFGLDLFSLWDGQIKVVDDYASAKMDFISDLDLAPPKGED